MSRQLAASLIVCVLCWGFVHAGEFVVGAYVGGNHTQQSVFRISQPVLETDLSLKGVRWEARAFERPFYWGVRAAYFLRKLGSWEFGPEFEFIHLKVFLETGETRPAEGILQGTSIRDDLPVGEVIESFNISHGVDLHLFNLVLRRGLWPDRERPEGRVVLVARVGAGFNISHFEATISSLGRHEEDEFGGGAYQGAFGVQWPVFDPISLFAEYKFTTTSPRGEVPGGEAEMNLNTHHVVTGLAFHW